jgi:hypothetical protein
MEIRVFVSYTGDDEVKAEKLVSQLKSNNLEVWFDQEQIFPGDELKPVIKDGIFTAHIFLACISRNYVSNFKNSWTERELKIAISNEEKKNVKKIIPIRFERANGNQLPEILGKRAFADLSNESKWNKNFNRLVESIKKIAKEQSN